MLEGKEVKGLQTIVKLHCYWIVISIDIVISCGKNAPVRVISLHRETGYSAFSQAGPAELFLVVGPSDSSHLNDAAMIAIDDDTLRMWNCL